MSTRHHLWFAMVCVALVGSLVGCGAGELAAPPELAAQVDQLFTLDLTSGESWLGNADAERLSLVSCRVSALKLPSGAQLSDNLFQWKPTEAQAGLHELDLVFEGSCDGLMAADTYLIDVAGGLVLLNPGAQTQPIVPTLAVHDLE